MISLRVRVVGLITALVASVLLVTPAVAQDKDVVRVAPVESAFTLAANPIGLVRVNESLCATTNYGNLCVDVFPAPT